MIRAIPVVATALAILLTAAPSAAQYAFEVPSMSLEVHVRKDASVELRYEMVFRNHGQAIDVVDIGLPHENYDRQSARARIDGVELQQIVPSTYIDNGLEVHLHQHAIPWKKSGTFVFEVVVFDMVYNDTTDDTQASLRITPTWFDGNLLQGTTDLRIGIFLPPGVDAARVRHQGIHGSADYRLGEHEGGLVAGFRFPTTRVDGARMVGVSFPRDVMARVVVITKLELLLRWWEAALVVRVIAFGVLCALMGLFFFRFSGGTGWSVFILVAGATGWLYYALPRVHFYTWPLWLGLGLWMHKKLQRSRTKYLPPIASVEGGGVKRGLTAPEAAVLLEMPLGRVLTLVIFGMLKKGLIEQVEAEPLRVRVREELGEVGRAKRRKAAAELGVVIHKYEHAFVRAIANVPGNGADVEGVDFGDAMKGLIEHVAERMIGWDVEATRTYYRSIVERAWRSASSIGELEQRTHDVDKNLEWLLMDPGYAGRFDSWGHSGYHYQPSWIRAYTPIGASAPTADRGNRSAPSASDVGASFAGWSENVAGRFIETLSPTTLTGRSGVINLAGADKTTGEVLSGLFSSSGGGGGGGGGGGCACAGCACACACAGGGR